MTFSNRMLTVVATGAVALGAAPAFAAGTTAGSTITNVATVNYQVLGNNQTAVTGTNAIVVDRKVILTMTSAAATTSVAPNQTGAAETFTITNASNDTIDIGLSLAQQTGGTAVHGGLDSFDSTNVRFYADTNTNGSFDAGDTLITYLDEVAPDATRTVFVVSDIPIGQINGDVAGNTLTATAQEGGTAGTQGAVLTTTATNTAGVDTVLADAAGATDAAFDGLFSARGGYTVAAPVLTVTKTSTLISDPVSGTSNPKAIPGAVLEYCIIVANGAGGATASNLTVSDPLPATVAFSSSYGIFVDGSVSGSTCNTDGTAGGSYNAGSTTVSGALSNLAAGTSGTLRFRAVIQ